MAWLQSLDVTLLRLINLQWQHPWLDVVMPFLSWNGLFVPLLLVTAILLAWKGGARGRLFVFLMVLLLAFGDSVVINALKHAVGRARPFEAVPDIRLLVGKGTSASLPSSHTANWVAATFLAFLYYRRTWRFLLPVAVAVGYARIYVGAHYPSDVLVGAMVGAGYTAAGLLGLNFLWQKIGPAWFPLWWAKLPSLLRPTAGLPSASAPATRAATVDQHWLRLGYGIIAVICFTRLAYLASGKFELSEDEAYQWLWSKHLALSYYSKPPLIAYAQFLGTHLWGDTELGVRFCAPVIAALLSVLVLRFLTREVSGRTAFWLVLILNFTPLLAVGSTLFTVDPLLVLFWTLAMILGWRALRPEATTRDWLAMGLAMGLAFLSKYSSLFQLGCWAIFFWLWPPARVHLRRPGPWLALLVNLLCTLPVLIWNAQHDWITVDHVSHNAALSKPWTPTPRFFADFVGAEAILLNPVFFVAALWAIAGLWHSTKQTAPPEPHSSKSKIVNRKSKIEVYLFSMGAPVFLGYWLYTFHSRVLPNWIAPAVVPMFCHMAIFWERRWRQGARATKVWLTAGLILGTTVVAALQEPSLIKKVIGHPLPPDKDPLRRVRAWKETVHLVGQARTQLLAEGKPVFILANHYGLTGLISFYLPEAKLALPDSPLAYCASIDRPKNQFYFWPRYRYQDFRQGQNAIYVEEVTPPRYFLKKGIKSLFEDLGKRTPRSPAPGPEGWTSRLPSVEPPERTPRRPAPEPAPQKLLNEFVSVKDVGVWPVYREGRVYRWVQLFECRDLR